MNKEKHVFLFVLFMILVCMLFSGCGDRFALETIPRDMVIYQSQAESLQESFRKEAELLPGAQVVAEQAGMDGEQAKQEDEPIFLMEEAGDYAFLHLNEAEQVWYRDIERILGSFQENIKLSEQSLADGLNAGHIDKIFQYVLNDHPELFFVEGYSYTIYSVGEAVTDIEFSGTYSMDRETALVRKAEIEKQTAEILSGIENSKSEYDKVKYVYDTLINSTEYRPEAADNQNIYSVIVNHESVCQGYAKATQFLLNKMGLECVLVIGTVDTGCGHAWNLVRIDGAYYYLDSTWGDASYQRLDSDSSSELRTDTISYDYLNVTTKELLRTHTVGKLLPMPECTAMDANYYVREGNYFTGYDDERFEELFAEAFWAGEKSVTIKCSDAETYEEIRRILIEEQKIFGFLQESNGKVAFSGNEKQMSLSFWVTNE